MNEPKLYPENQVLTYKEYKDTFSVSYNSEEIRIGKPTYKFEDLIDYPIIDHLSRHVLGLTTVEELFRSAVSSCERYAMDENTKLSVEFTNKIKSAGFIKRLKYLFTGELDD